MNKKSKIACLIFLFFLVAASAHADTSQTYLEKAITYLGYGDYQESLKLLDFAKGLAKDAKQKAQVYLYIGINNAVLGKVSEAEKAFSWALTFDPFVSLDRGQFKPSLFDFFEKVRTQPRTKVTITSNQKGAKIFIEQKNIGIVPQSIQLPLGKYEIEVQSIDGAKQIHYATLEEGKSEKLFVKFEKELAQKVEKAQALLSQAKPSQAKPSQAKPSHR